MNKHKELLIAIALIAVMLLVVTSIVRTAHHKYIKSAHTTTIERDEYPDIPQCDKELWDRIREGCE